MLVMLYHLIVDSPSVVYSLRLGLILFVFYSFPVWFWWWQNHRAVFPGFLAVMLAREYPDISITAVDILPSMATVAGEYIAENGLQDRISYMVADVNDRDFLQKLGKFDFVYSTFSLHDWKPPDNAIRNLWEAVADKGILYIHDFRKLGFLRFLPVNDEGLKSMQASCSPGEARDAPARTGITGCTIKSPFPYIFLTAIARKSSS